jgi:archaellum component FlaC
VRFHAINIAAVGRSNAMTENVENLILERLRRMDERLGNMEDDIRGIKTRVSAIDEHLAGMLISLGGLNSRMDKFDEPVARVERRLELLTPK